MRRYCRNGILPPHDPIASSPAASRLWRAPRVKELFKRGSTTIVIGPGGVGKTTVAAAIGLASASRGLATGVITVDPARRLREA
ncbi:MAG: ArsA-related P-loop ATPase, partial [Candidatus Binataceae bacterium]